MLPFVRCHRASLALISRRMPTCLFVDKMCASWPLWSGLKVSTTSARLLRHAVSTTFPNEAEEISKNGGSQTNNGMPQDKSLLAAAPGIMPRCHPLALGASSIRAQMRHRKFPAPTASLRHSRACRPLLECCPLCGGAGMHAPSGAAHGHRSPAIWVGPLPIGWVCCEAQQPQI